MAHVVHRKLIQIVPAGNLQAVRQKTGTTMITAETIERSPLDFVGLAKREIWERGEFVEDDGTEIVGVELVEGDFNIVNERFEFLGFARRGEDITITLYRLREREPGQPAGLSDGPR